MQTLVRVEEASKNIGIIRCGPVFKYKKSKGPSERYPVIGQLSHREHHRNMKTILVVLAVCFCAVGTLGALTEEQKAKLKAYRDSCIAETGIDVSVVENAKNGQIDENNEKLACFATCMLKKIGIMNPDGSINEEVARAKIPPSVPQEKADELFNKCRDVSGATTCEKGGNLMKCFKENKTFSILN